jgi:hypothetical protein
VANIGKLLWPHFITHGAPTRVVTDALAPQNDSDSFRTYFKVAIRLQSRVYCLCGP